MKVFVYCHVRTGRLSIRALEGSKKGLVIAHAEKLSMRDVNFSVSEAGRQRVLSEGRKNVHAGAVGHIDAAWGLQPRFDDLEQNELLGIGLGGVFKPMKRGSRVHYHPKESSTFVRRTDGAPVLRTKRLMIDGCGALTASGLVTG